jgi:S-adenosylmethionine synthetase
MGRTPQIVEKVFENAEGKKKKVKVELFTWEKLDYDAKVKKAFKLK